jgi:hypothetical protein
VEYFYWVTIRDDASADRATFGTVSPTLALTIRG